MTVFPPQTLNKNLVNIVKAYLKKKKKRRNHSTEEYNREYFKVQYTLWTEIQWFLRFCFKTSQKTNGGIFDSAFVRIPNIELGKIMNEKNVLK